MLTKTKNTHRHGFGASVAHGQIQYHLKTQIASLELEKKLGNRRADALWEEKKIVFEIQLSSISLQEVLARNSDYQTLGYQVVWILHEGLFNGRSLSPAEQHLRTSCPTYFTNGDAIYDQVEVLQGQQRLYRGTPLPVQMALPCSPFIQIPGRTWPLHFVGDVHSLCATRGVEEVKNVLKMYTAPRRFKRWAQFVGFRILELVSTNQK
jgi:hypothetical protein